MNTQLPSSSRTLRLAGVTPSRLRELIRVNLDALEGILRWNTANGIRVFRLTSNLIPFGSHVVNELAWWDEFAPRFRKLGRLIFDGGMRISTHPGQYTVLSSARPHVVDAAVAELVYHDRLLGAFGLDRSHKIVLHVGSGAAKPEETLARLTDGFERLPPSVAGRLALEHDERWSLDSVLRVAEQFGLPVVFDVFHHRLAPSLEGLGVRDLVLRAGETWRMDDGRQEVHFSTQEPGRRAGAHAEEIDLEEFSRFASEVGDLPLDCIIEVKDKERSVLRARRLLDPNEHSSAYMTTRPSVGG